MAPPRRRIVDTSERFAALVAACFVFAGCKLTVVTELPGSCPTIEPDIGAPCYTALTCGYPSPPCGSAFTCLDGVWQPVQGSCVPPAGECPKALPTVGAPCKSPGQACDFTFPGDCGGAFVARCSDAGQWQVEDHSPPCMPPMCPATEPIAGTPCDHDVACTYAVVPPGCAPETHDATCSGGVWQVVTPGTCVP